MDKAKLVITLLATHFKLTKEQSLLKEEEQAYMKKVPYTSNVRNLIYAIVCTRQDIAHAVEVVSQFMGNTGKQH